MRYSSLEWTIFLTNKQDIFKKKNNPVELIFINKQVKHCAFSQWTKDGTLSLSNRMLYFCVLFLMHL